MDKLNIGPRAFLYPLPTTLVGANVNGRANYEAIAYCGVLNHAPPIIAVSSGHKHYTNVGIKENGTFSVNIPSVEMVAVTDYCGLVSGHDEDKSTLFESFYGELGTAPMIVECPLSLECKLVQTLVFATNEAFVGEVVAAYSDETYLTDGVPDVKKIRPIVFSLGDNNYWTVGDRIGKAWSIGKEFALRAANG